MRMIFTELSGSGIGDRGSGIRDPGDRGWAIESLFRLAPLVHRAAIGFYTSDQASFQTA